MKLSDTEKRTIIAALNFKAQELDNFLKHTNATDRQWQQLDELNELSTYLEYTLIDDNYVR
jgi:Spy/CpxP family protein refolding chaperone